MGKPSNAGRTISWKTEIRRLCKDFCIPVIIASGLMFGLIVIEGTVMLSSCVKANANDTEIVDESEPETTNPTYPSAGIVTSVNYDTDTVIVTTAEGMQWAFYEPEDWKVGDVCAMVMDSMDTESIYDDQIIECRYAGTYDDIIEMDLYGEWK